jgi:hypothetical protein
MKTLISIRANSAPIFGARQKWIAPVPHLRLTALVLLILLAAVSAPALADFKLLTGRLPYGSNAFIAVDTEKLFQSSMARNAGWSEAQPAGPGRQPRLVLPNTRRLVVGSMLNLSNMRPLWSASVMEPSGVIAPAALFSRVQGARTDNLGMMPAVWAPSDAYFFQLDGTSFGAVTPADRQFAVRWLAQIATPATNMPLKLPTSPTQQSYLQLIWPMQSALRASSN